MLIDEHKQFLLVDEYKQLLLIDEQKLLVLVDEQEQLVLADEYKQFQLVGVRSCSHSLASRSWLYSPTASSSSIPVVAPKQHFSK